MIVQSLSISSNQEAVAALRMAGERLPSPDARIVLAVPVALADAARRRPGGPAAALA